MKTLNLHVDYIEWQALKKALKSIPDLSPKDLDKKRVEEALVVLTAVEKTDSKTKELIEKLVQDIKSISTQVNTKNIVLYPYAHLSKNLSDPDTAIRTLDEAEKALKKEKFNVSRAPFGYYKTFELKVKGHPLSELSRDFIIKENETIEDIDDTRRRVLLNEISKFKLDTSKLAENDHRIIGRKMDLWSFNSSAPGMVFWHDKGLYIKNKLIDYWRQAHRAMGYEEISTPQIMDRKLWEISGHWSKYSENNFKTIYEGRDFLVKPMNCPGGMLVYKNSPKSHKDLPLKMAELGIVHRVELSGVLAGLFRVIQFTQDDAHIFCTEEQFEDEISKVMDLAKAFYDHFGLTIDHVELSTRPEKRIGSEKFWDLSEKALEDLLKKKKVKFVINEGDGAFYGPKIDYHVRDSLGRTWQCATIQLDMALPERFELEYLDKDGKMKRPIMVHRTIYGSFERFLGMLTENVNGNFPLWLSPNQVKVMTMSEKIQDYAKEVTKELFDAGFKVELDARDEKIGKKVRDASIEKFNYLVTIGEEEKKGKLVAVKKNGEEKVIKIKLKEFISNLTKEADQGKWK